MNIINLKKTENNIERKLTREEWVQLVSRLNQLMDELNISGDIRTISKYWRKGMQKFEENTALPVFHDEEILKLINEGKSLPEVIRLTKKSGTEIATQRRILKIISYLKKCKLLSDKEIKEFYEGGIKHQNNTQDIQILKSKINELELKFSKIEKDKL